MADSIVAARLTTEQVTATAVRLPGTVVSVTQFWELGFALDGGEGASNQAAKLEAACQATSPDCALVLSRRRALQGSDDGRALLTRSLTTGNLAAEITNLESSGVVVTSSSFHGVDILLSVTEQGGAAEANALLDGSLAEDQVRTTISADLGLAEDSLFIDVQQPIFPPMPPPSLPPSPLSPPPPPLSPPPLPPSLLPPPTTPPPSGDSLSDDDAVWDAGVLRQASGGGAGAVSLCLLVACVLRRRQKGARSLTLGLGGARGSVTLRPSDIGTTVEPTVLAQAIVHSMDTTHDELPGRTGSTPSTTSPAGRSSWALPAASRAPPPIEGEYV